MSDNEQQGYDPNDAGSYYRYLKTTRGGLE
jgi:hypothetical protein